MTARFITCRMNVGGMMPRKAMSESDPLVPKQVSLPVSLKNRLRQAAEKTHKSESEIVRQALLSEIDRIEADKQS